MSLPAQLCWNVVRELVRKTSLAAWEDKLAYRFHGALGNINEET